MKDRFLARRDRLRRAVKKTGADALLVTDFTNVTYLTGFSGDDSYLLVRRDGDTIISDSRYTTQLEEESPGLDVQIRVSSVSMLSAVSKAVKAANLGRLGIEGDSMSVALRDRLAAAMPKLDVRTTSSLVEGLREIKDKHEIAQLKSASKLAAKAFAALRATLLPEKTEIQVRNELEYQMRLLGAQEAAFPSIIAAGPRAALPHAVPSDRPIGESDFLLVDWGARSGHYCSDLTRVLVTGKLSTKLQRVYGVVFSAQQAAIRAIRPGVTGGEVDAVARGLISDAGFGRRFGHGLGHGLGLQVHEAPRLAASSTTVLKPGMVVTVEPGIYIPGWGGVRIEDDVLVTKTGYEVLTDVPKEFEQSIVD